MYISCIKTNENEENIIDKLEKFAKTKLSSGRHVIKGYPVDIEDNPDGNYIEMEAVDRDACTGLIKELRKAGFKTSRNGNTGISIS